MKMSRMQSTLTLAALFIASTMVATADGTRLLVSNDDVTASLDQAFSCNRDAPIVIRAAEPDVFEMESRRMQSIVDTVQAVLRYECPDLSRITLTGYLTGLEQSVFSGFAARSDNWQVEAERVVRDAGDTATPATPESGREIAVASNRLDMTVDQVRENLLTVFGAEPEYDAARGLMNLELGGCPPEYLDGGSNAEPGAQWTCVRAWFTDRRIPTLSRLAYTQVAQGTVADTRRVLVERFGQPDIDESNGAERMAWTIQGEGNDLPSEVLSATMRRSGSNVVVEINLEDPGLTGRDPLNDSSGDHRAGSNVELKL
jgi:hypothetical protein